MTVQGTHENFQIDRVIYGKPAATTLAAEAERLDARRVFMLVSSTLDRETTWVQDMRDALGARYAGSHGGMPSHTPRDAVLAATDAARAAGADLIVTFGGGSGTDGQILVTVDMIWLFATTPSFVKRYAEWGAAIDEAAAHYAEEVKSRRFPAREHTYSMRD